MQEAILNLMA